VEVVGVAHGQAEGFRFVAAGGDDAAVVVRQHHDRAALEARAEDPLAAHVVE
jgi:hypothetical protein